MSETKARKQDKQEEEEEEEQEQEEAFIQFHDSDDGTCLRRDGHKQGREEGKKELEEEEGVVCLPR